jgi:hypothetical protein
MSQPEGERLDSWKEIATYLGRDLRTVRRWEEKGLPVHRVPGGERRAVFAYRAEINSWLLRTDHECDGDGNASFPPSDQGNHEPRHLHGKMAPSASLPVQNIEAPQPTPSFPITSLQKSSMVLGAALITCTALILLGLVFFASRKATQAADPLGSGVPVVPRGIEHWLRISLVNGQAQALTGPFQQQVVVDSSKNAQFEADNLQNVEFFDERGEILKSWLESGNSRFSGSTVYWIQLPDGIPARKVVDIYQGFAAPNQNLFNGSNNGEAPVLSPNYGENDNGSLVFLKYADFAGDSLPLGWYVGTTPGGQGQVQVKNGVFLSHSGRGGGAAFLGSDWIVGDNIAEMSLLSQQTVNGQEMIFVCSASPTRFRWTPVSVGYQNMSGLEIEDNNSGTPSVLATAKPNPTQSAVIGFQGGTLYADYQPVARISQRICGGGYLASSVNTGYLASFSFDWIRLRTSPPNGVMPTVIFGESK